MTPVAQAAWLRTSPPSLPSVATLWAVVTGVVVRDTSHVFSHTALDDELITDQARTVLEDIPVRAIKVGFAGSPANLAAIAELSSDYPDIPIVSYMPDLSWWQGDRAGRVPGCLPGSCHASNLGVGWQPRNAQPLAAARLVAKPPAPAPGTSPRLAEALDVPFVLVTGIPLPEQHMDNVLASDRNRSLAAASSSCSMAAFSGAGDTLSAALTALLAAGNDLGAAAQEALEYLDRSLGSGFRPGMGQLIPDRMFWAQPEEGADARKRRRYRANTA